jgi:hypothetical protein
VTVRAAATSDHAGVLRRAAMQSVLLGVGFELAPLTADLVTGSVSGADVIAGVAQGLVFAVVLCMSLVVGVRRAARLALIGAIAGPVAWVLGAVLHEVVDAVLVSSATDARGPSLIVTAVRGIEYAALGALLGWVRHRPSRAWVGSGLAVGILAGAIVVPVVASTASGLSTADLVAQGANEIFFPAGCALIVRGAAGRGQPRAGAPS